MDRGATLEGSFFRGCFDRLLWTEQYKTGGPNLELLFVDKQLVLLQGNIAVKEYLCPAERPTLCLYRL